MQSEINTDLKEAVESAMAKADACGAVRDVYARLQVEIEHRKPICVASGKCCHFESYGHRLYVTTLELATFKADRTSNVQHQPSNPKAMSSLPMYREREPDGCPLQIDNLCSVHLIRPFGCRIFFCDPTATDWQQQQYELFHQELKKLHERFNVPYFYVEWRTALKACF